MILIADDDIAIRTSLNLLLSQKKYKIDTASNPDEILYQVRTHTYSLILLDMNFSMKTSGEEGLEILQKIKILSPDAPVILITGWGTISLAVEGIKLGAFDFITKPWNNNMLLKSIENALQLSESKKDTSIINSRKELDSLFNFDNIIGESSKVLDTLKIIGKIAKTTATVLITGESGTGKELIAEAIHNNSKRKNQPFVKVNLGAIPSQLFESEMFGHIKGAFTDAQANKIGRFELADQGTIFLDEIGELDIASQVKLLRVLQEQTFEPIGSSKSKQVDVRVICATNKNLSELIDNGLFREDLFYRINLLTIQNPNLNQRKEDITLLSNYFLNTICQKQNLPRLSLSKSAFSYLKNRNYKGNIRELRNLIERTAIIADNTILSKEDFETYDLDSTLQLNENPIEIKELITIEQMEKKLIISTLENYKWNISKTAKSLGLSRGALYRRFDKYGIEYKDE